MKSNYELFLNKYTEIQRRIKKRPDYEFYAKERDRKMINSFLDQYKNEGISFIENFLVFQFGVYKDLDTKFGKGVIQLNWIIGKKAVLRWQKRKDGANYYIEQNKAVLTKKTPRKTKIKAVNKILFNSYRILTSRDETHIEDCIELELFDEKNKYCQTCKLSDLCK